LDNQQRSPFTRRQLIALLLTAAPLTLPLLSPGMIWLYSLLPMVVVYRLTAHGYKQGLTLVLQALILAAVLALFTGMMVGFLLGLAMVLLGFVLAQAMYRGDSLTMAGIKGVGYLTGLWLLLWALAGDGDTSPIQALLANIDQNLSAAWGQEKNAATLEYLRNFIARAWPALLLISLISLVWFNLATSHWLLRGKHPSLSPWPELKQWRLPDYLVAPAALVLLLLLLGFEPLATFGLNGLLVLGMLYFMQGLAIMSHMLAYWQLPLWLRGFCYFLVLMQIYGLILLALLGLADIRLGFRERFVRETN